MSLLTLSLSGKIYTYLTKKIFFRILSGAYAKTLPVIWAVSGIILAAFAVWFIPFALRIRPSVPQMLFTCVMAAVIPVSLCAHSVSDCRIIQKELEYALTSCRAIAVRGNSEMFMRIDENTPYRTEIQEDGTEIFISAVRVTCALPEAEPRLSWGFTEIRKIPPG